MKSPRQPLAPPATRQTGVVLIISLVMLVVISLLATFSIRNSVSSEAVSGNVRTSQLASQAAEVALRFCENAISNFVKTGAVLPTTGAGSTLTIRPYVDPPLFENLNNWDAARTGVFVLDAGVLNLAGSPATFKRMPECLVERVPVVNASSTALNTTSTYLITARGFGPEVAAGTARPDGSEVWLQSTIELE